MGPVTSLTTPPTRPASRPVTRPVALDRPRQGSWDPLLRPIAWCLLLFALVLNSAAIAYKVDVPNTVPLLVGLACIGLSLILPRSQSVIVPVGAVSILGLGLLSVLWSADEAATVLWARSSAMVTVGITALVLVLPTDETIKVLKAFVHLVLVVTLVAVAVDSTARIHIDPLGASPDLKGWHGWFVHKNILATFLVLALAVVIEFDHHRWTRWMSLSAIVFLFAVSDSTTGRMAAVVLVAVQLWFITNRRLNRRSSAALAASTAALVAVIGLAIGLSLSAIADAAGKDLTFTGRTKIWSATWRAILDHPLVGHGISGLFSVPNTVQTSQVLRDIGFVAGHPHNGVLDVLVQLGIVGLVVVTLVITAVFRSSLRLQRRSPQMAAWAMCLMAALVVMSVGESVFLGSSIAVIIVMRTLQLREERATPQGIESASIRRRRS